ncbi:MAG: MOSC domain-containing protein [Anaerolineales bacterium]|nr:MOSC domain-containing protein [Anaerolineales bacterium]MCB9126431.1 MOSC domain-containing protein [Ardenticatenales bacterium]MCB9171592.1 MOSC domain-containing protein [Ardenticatenales bacterium]
MHLTSINRGDAERLGNRKSKTGIFKRPIDEGVVITQTGIPHDAVCNKKHHGGPDQALYLYGEADYDFWRRELGRALPPGTFGENLTISELRSDILAIGDLLQIGAVTLQVSAPRIPCSTFAERMAEPMWVQRFRAAERPGVYCRVLQGGPIAVGDEVSVVPYSGERVSIVQMFRDFYQKSLDDATLRRYLALPIAIRSRSDYEAQLAQRPTG